VKSLFLEGLAVALIGLGLAFAANALSPRGLQLSRDYFPTDTQVRSGSGSPTSSAAGSVSNAPSSAELLAQKLKALGVRYIGSNEVVALFHDPRAAADVVTFIDARNEEHYSQGHIPGAFLLDYYRPQDHLVAVLPAAQAAEAVVVYCNGGSCEDSQLTTLLLNDAGVPPDKLQIYLGGFAEWETNGLPVEVGERRSGQLRPGK
jgi:rhodanese-related sulfurtransferase